MKTVDLIEETLSAVTANKTRSGLTMLGIVIGIASVIAMVAIGQGAQASIQANIQSLGANLLTVTPGAQRTPGSTVSTGRGTAQTLTKADSDAIQSGVTQISGVSPESSGRYQIVAGGNNTNTTVIGSEPVYPQVHNLTFSEGSFFSAAQVSSYAKVAVIGPNVVTDLFTTGADPVGQTININNIPFTVIGVTVSEGGTSFSSPDNNIYIPLSTAQQFLTGTQYVTSIAVQAQSQAAMTSVQQQITTLLLTRHGISNPAAADFSVINQATVVATASSVTGVFTTLLASVAGISLLVGGIGIMNMMLTTVTERTREIGLRKAIGAQRGDISTQFLVEAVMLTFLGGAIGVVLGWLASLAVSHFASIATQVSMGSVFLAFGVSAAIGIIFGYYPATRAARLNPIEALRYE
jgi:putative ABC transport system permease protein